MDVLQACELGCLVLVDPFAARCIVRKFKGGFKHSRLLDVDESHFTLESLGAVDSGDSDPVCVTCGESIYGDHSRFSGYGNT